MNEDLMEVQETAADEKAFAESAFRKWSGTGLLEGYPDTFTKRIMAQIYECQERRQIRDRKIHEADQTTSTLPTSVFPTRVVYPLLDQIFPNLIAMKLCDIRPMRGPTARFIYRTYKLSSGEVSFTHTGSPAKTTETGTVPLARMTLASADITAEKFSLRARYSLEVVDDAVADGIDFESEMMAALRDEITGEIDYVVLRDMFDSATADAVSWNSDYTSHSNETYKEHQLEIFDAVVDANNNVFTKMQRDTNFIVGNPTAVGRLEKCQQFRIEQQNPDDVFQVGSVRVGTLANKWAVYKSTMAPASKLLVGIARMGYMFCPYVPLELNPYEYHSATEEMSRGVRTRLGRKVTRGDCFSVITIS